MEKKFVKIYTGCYHLILDGVNIGFVSKKNGYWWATKNTGGEYIQKGGRSREKAVDKLIRFLSSESNDKVG